MTDGDEHPLALIAPASHWFLNTIFANKPDLMEQGGRAADHAAPRRCRRARALQTGDSARIFNARGSFVAARRGLATWSGPA